MTALGGDPAAPAGAGRGACVAPGVRSVQLDRSRAL